MPPKLHQLLYIVISYLLISSIAIISLALGSPVDQLTQLIAYQALSWLGLWALLKSPRWLHILLLPAFLAVPIEIYLRVYFNQGISTHHLGIIAETSPKEAIEFLGHKIWLLLVVMLGMFGWWLSILRTCRQSSALDWAHWSRWPTVMIFLTGIGIWGYGEQVGVAGSASKSSSATLIAANSTSQLKPSSWASGISRSMGISKELESLLQALPLLPQWAKIPYDDKIFVRSWPFGLILRGADFWSERNYLARLSEKSREFTFHARQTPATPAPQTIVVVIGESSRYDRWGINGYQRDTTPLLKLESNLVSFSDVTTAVAATRLSVPVIVSRKPAAQSLKAGFSEKSFISAFREAGFKTYWLSNQMSFGEFDTPTSVFAKEADVTQFLNLGGFTNASNYDQVLFEPMQNAMLDPAPKKLIVLHSLGNHWNYSHRHPKEYDKWQPSLFGVSNPAYTNLKNKQALNNSYDNSILYTDWFLSQLISRLKDSEQISSLLYVSDHGQTLYDGNCKLAFHGHNTQYEFHIPVFMWFSDRYQTQHPDKISQLHQHKDAKLSTENIFHSLLDMADIRYPDEKLERSFLSSRLKAHTRYVDSYGWSNYDNSTFKGDCREVMDKKTPISQEK